VAFDRRLEVQEMRQQLTAQLIPQLTDRQERETRPKWGEASE